jgi:hypothetical protein
VTSDEDEEDPDDEQQRDAEQLGRYKNMSATWLVSLTRI